MKWWKYYINPKESKKGEKMTLKFIMKSEGARQIIKLVIDIMARRSLLNDVKAGTLSQQWPEEGMRWEQGQKLYFTIYTTMWVSVGRQLPPKHLVISWCVFKNPIAQRCCNSDGHVTINLYWECSSYSQQSSFIQEEEVPLLVWGTESWVEEPLFELSCAGFYDKLRLLFCFVFLPCRGNQMQQAPLQWAVSDVAKATKSGSSKDGS